MSEFECWQNDKHPVLFDSKAYYPSFSLKRVYGNLNEFRLLDKAIPKKRRLSLVEVGCAGGELYRYFKYNYPNIVYAGYDVSESAIEIAKRKYPKGNFLVTDSNLLQIENVNSDYLLSRDVVLHQEDPFDFLKRLINIPKKGAVIKLRTRDVGSTELDVNKSCQFYLGTWIPYMILNCDEIIAFLESLKICSKVVFLKNYKPLGGVNNRYLPKDCYLKSTGTSYTAIYVELSDNSEKMEVIVENRNDDRMPFIFDRFLCKLIKFTKGSKGYRFNRG